MFTDERPQDELTEDEIRERDREGIEGPSDLLDEPEDLEDELLDDDDDDDDDEDDDLDLDDLEDEDELEDPR